MALKARGNRIPSLKDKVQLSAPLRYRSSYLKKMLGVYGREIYLLIWRHRDHWETCPDTKELAGAVSLSHTPSWTHKDMQKPTQYQYLLPSLLTACPVPVL